MNSVDKENKLVKNDERINGSGSGRGFRRKRSCEFLPTGRTPGKPPLKRCSSGELTSSAFATDGKNQSVGSPAVRLNTPFECDVNSPLRDDAVTTGSGPAFATTPVRYTALCPFSSPPRRSEDNSVTPSTQRRHAVRRMNSLARRLGSANYCSPNLFCSPPDGMSSPSNIDDLSIFLGHGDFGLSDLDSTPPSSWSRRITAPNRYLDEACGGHSAFQKRSYQFFRKQALNSLNSPSLAPRTVLSLVNEPIIEECESDLSISSSPLPQVISRGDKLSTEETSCSVEDRCESPANKSVSSLGFSKMNINSSDLSNSEASIEDGADSMDLSLDSDGHLWTPRGGGQFAENFASDLELSPIVASGGSCQPTRRRRWSPDIVLSPISNDFTGDDGDDDESPCSPIVGDEHKNVFECLDVVAAGGEAVADTAIYLSSPETPRYGRPVKPPAAVASSPSPSNPVVVFTDLSSDGLSLGSLNRPIPPTASTMIDDSAISASGLDRTSAKFMDVSSIQRSRYCEGPVGTTAMSAGNMSSGYSSLATSDRWSTVAQKMPVASGDA